jgi:hypothetical protein
LSGHLETASSECYGVAGIEYLTKLVAETRDLYKEFINAVNGLIGDEELSPQEARGAKRFALASIAGVAGSVMDYVFIFSIHWRKPSVTV